MDCVASHIKRWTKCRRCPLAEIAHRGVFLERIPEGTNELDILFVSEGPGRAEDRFGQPFTGSAGKFLRRIIEKSDTVGVRYGFTNLLAHRAANSPSGENRPPSFAEMDACEPRTAELIAMLKPKIVAAMGTTCQNRIPVLMKRMAYDAILVNIQQPAAVMRNLKTDPLDYHEFVGKIQDMFGAAKQMR